MTIEQALAMIVLILLLNHYTLGLVVGGLMWAVLLTCDYFGI